MDYTQGYKSGVMYFVCIEDGKEDQPDFCPTLYKYMAKYAKKTKGPFSSITLADITDKQAYYERKGGGW